MSQRQYDLFAVTVEFIQCAPYRFAGFFGGEGGVSFWDIVASIVVQFNSTELIAKPSLVL